MNGLGRAGRDARWAARRLILSDSGAGPDCGCYCDGCGCYRDGCAGDSDGDRRGPRLSAGSTDSGRRTHEEAKQRLAGAPPHLARRLAAAGASAPPPAAELGLTDRRGRGRGRGRGGRGGRGVGGGAGVKPRWLTGLCGAGWMASSGRRLGQRKGLELRGEQGRGES